MTLEPTPRPAHSILGASSSKRWLACPASVSLSKGLSPTTSWYAAEGQAAHALAAQCFMDSTAPFDLVGTVFESDLGEITVTEEMAEAVEVYLSLCRAIACLAKFCEVEKEVEVNDLWPDGNPPTDMFGTSDFVGWGGKNRVLYIVDYKHGKGLAVDIEKNGELNSQLLYYALGVLLWIMNKSKENRPVWVEIIVVQPRADHPSGPIRKARLSTIDLLSWGKEILKPGAEACFEGSPKAVVGDVCRWCPARGQCPALRQVAQQAARVEFDSLPPQPNELSGAELGEILDKAEIIHAFLEGVRAEASGRIDRGSSVPGWKLVQKRGIRKWDDDEAVLGKLDDLGVSRDKVVVSKVRSPAQIEKLLKKDSEAFGELADHITKDSSGTTLVRELDPRTAAAASPASDFDVIKGD